ncbi:Putative glycosyltransferase EpsE [Symmachiella dynata]|uniref:Glycosyltransferase EpsE n=1 Tax=Symmachiella dynata TaxID=2527995 RepID=A0A517ZX10_9PLAN|nr:glycosyltransferase [Symmachiella dynata]QDU47033.1 Putative glycosyltransferase EpsE [Symmachiella dynata]
MKLREDCTTRPTSMTEADEIIAAATREHAAEQIVTEPLLSVCIITYNQHRFIRQAVDSVLAQKTDFPYEIIIGDDQSNDGTTEIAQELQQSHPDKIRVLTATENLGQYTGNGRLNMIRTLRASRGKYVAMLEGDDYWTSTQKLQQQVHALETHSDWAICFHSTHCFWDDASNPGFNFPLEFDRDVSTIEDLIDGNFMQTCSVVYRNGLFGNFPDWFLEAGLGDWPLHILNAQHGDIGYLPETMSAYRVHPGGVWTSKSQQDCEAIISQLYLLLHRNLPRHLSDLAGKRLLKEFVIQIDGLHGACKKYDQAIKTLEQHIVKLNAQHERSSSYRLGRSLLSPLRMLRTLFRTRVSAQVQ